MSRLRPTVSSPEFGHISRVDGDKKLLDYETQELFFGQIKERHTLRKLRDTTEDTNDVDQGSIDACMSALRKLREGIVASRREDLFAIDVFERTVRCAILVNHKDAYMPTMRYLIRTLYPNAQGRICLKSRDILHSLYLIHLFMIGDHTEYMVERSKLGERKGLAHEIVRAYIQGNWTRWHHLLKDAAFLEAKLMQQTFSIMADHVLSTISASYMAVDIAWLTKASSDHWRAKVKDNPLWSLDEATLIFKRPGKLRNPKLSSTPQLISQ